MHELQAALKKLGFVTSETLMEFYLRSGKIVLLLDAFDELDEALVLQVLGEMEALADTYDKLQIFVTSRPQNVIQNSRHFQVIKLASLSPPEHEPFLRRIGLSEVETKGLLDSTSAGSSEVHDLLTTPLLMTLLVVVYRSEKSIPTDIPEFYQKLFETLFSKHDSSKPAFKRQHKSGLSERKLQQLFEAFCFCVLLLKLKTRLTKAEFGKAFDQALRHTSHISNVEVEGFRHDIVHVTCLMLEEGYDFHFLHKSVLEFFAAAFVASQTEAQAKRFYEQLPEARWAAWNQVLHFLSQIDRYRFLKYFEIPSIDAFFAKAGFGVEASSADAISLSKTIYKDVRIGFSVSSGGVDLHNIKLGAPERYRPAGRIYMPMIDFLRRGHRNRYREIERRLERKLSRPTPGSEALTQIIELTWYELFDETDRDKQASELFRELSRLRDERREHLAYLAKEDQKADLIHI